MGFNVGVISPSKRSVVEDLGRIEVCQAETIIARSQYVGKNHETRECHCCLGKPD